MAKNRRKTYDEAAASGEGITDGISCAKCGCKHNYVGKTERIGNVIRRRRHCRNCGYKFYTTESV